MKKEFSLTINFDDRKPIGYVVFFKESTVKKFTRAFLNGQHFKLCGAILLKKRKNKKGELRSLSLLPSFTVRKK